MVKIHVFERYGGKQIGIHHQSVAVVFGRAGKGDRSDGAAGSVFADTLYLHTGYGFPEVAFDLFREVARCHEDTVDTTCGESLDIVVYDGLAFDFKERLGCLFGHRAQSLAFSSGHKDGLERQTRAAARQIENIGQTAVGVKNRNHGDARTAKLAQVGGIDGAGTYAAERPASRIRGMTVEWQSCNKGAAYISVGEGSGHFSVFVKHEECHRTAGKRVERSDGIEYACVGLYSVFRSHSQVNYRNILRAIMVSAISQSSSLSRSTLRSAGMTEGTRRGKAPIGIRRIDSGRMT